MWTGTPDAQKIVPRENYCERILIPFQGNLTLRGSDNDTNSNSTILLYRKRSILNQNCFSTLQVLQARHYY